MSRKLELVREEKFYRLLPGRKEEQPGGGQRYRAVGRHRGTGDLGDTIEITYTEALMVILQSAKK